VQNAYNLAGQLGPTDSNVDSPSMPLGHFGKVTLGRCLGGGSDEWRALLERWRFDLVLCEVSSPFASLMKTHAGDR
jgi:hypothetical protein